MMFERETLIKELMWEYNYTNQEAKAIVDSYLDHGQYYTLIDKLAKNLERIPEYKE